MAIDTSAAAVTVKVVAPEIEPEVAEIVAVPVFTLLARPLVPRVLLMLAIDASEELQWTVVVRSWVELSVNVPVAMNCWLVPSGIEGIAGVIAIETSCAGEIVSEVDPVTEPEVAEIVVVPTATLVARPVLEILAAPVLEELHVDDEVRFCVLPSLNVPVAVNGWVVPSAIVEFAGETAMDCRAAASMVSDAVFETIDPDDAVTFVIPIAVLEASPVVVMVATEVFDRVQITDPDRSCVLPSVNVPVAANC